MKNIWKGSVWFLDKTNVNKQQKEKPELVDSLTYPMFFMSSRLWFLWIFVFN